ncbi:MAG: hypothetical protein HUJ66_00015 [Oscillospiraceae bacterium]|nr:hypothetical protein [Oscillospiraceae bacterium]
MKNHGKHRAGFFNAACDVEEDDVFLLYVRHKDSDGDKVTRFNHTNVDSYVNTIFELTMETCYNAGCTVKECHVLSLRLAEAIATACAEASAHILNNMGSEDRRNALPDLFGVAQFREYGEVRHAACAEAEADVLNNMGSEDRRKELLALFGGAQPREDESCLRYFCAEANEFGGAQPREDETDA